MTFRETLRHAKIAVLDDGRVTLGETSVLMRLVRPFVRQGNAGAVELEALLRKVRADGVITPEESHTICMELEKLSLSEVSLGSYVGEVVDFPKPGRTFCDVTGIFETSDGFQLALALFQRVLERTPFDAVVAPEPRGVILGAAVATMYGKPFIPICPPGRLPRETVSEEAGPRILQMHADVIEPGSRVVFVDDVLDSGRTAAASARLVARVGGEVVKMVFAVSRAGDGVSENLLGDYDVTTLVEQPGV